MPYDPILVQPMRDELTRLGIRELRTPTDVDAFLTDRAGTALLFVNSVCGCAAGNARPALAIALKNKVVPERMATVFAGQDTEATARAREYFPEVPHSSPCVFLLKDGELVLFIPRHTIENRDAIAVARELVTAFEVHGGHGTP